MLTVIAGAFFGLPVSNEMFSAPLNFGSFACVSRIIKGSATATVERQTTVSIQETAFFASFFAAFLFSFFYCMCEYTCFIYSSLVFI